MKRIVPALLGILIAAPAMADLPARTPGLWQSTSTVLGPNGKPVAHEVDVVTVSCVDALNDQKFFMSNQSACTSLTVSGSGNKYSISGTCNGQGQNLQIHMDLTYAGAQALQLKAIYHSAQGQMIVTSQLQWQGNCLSGMVPGDEGNIAGGAFVKADNINDSYNQ